MAGSSAVPGATYAGFFPRFIGLILDGILVSIVGGIVGAASGSWNSSSLVSLILSIAYYVYFFTSTGQTLGAKVMGIKVVDANGELLSMTPAVIRVIGSYVSAAILLIGYLMFFWDSKKQTLHDKMAGSFVVKA